MNFVSPDEAKDVYFADYARELDSLVSLVSTTIRSKKVETVLVFGMPGSGKSFFARKLQYQVNSRMKMDCALLTLKCNECATSSDYELRYISNELFRTQNFLHRWEDNGIILCLDELDFIAPDRGKLAGDPRYSNLALKLMGYISNSFGGCAPLVTLLITNYPRALESALLDRATTTVYLPPIGQSTAIQILSHYGIGSPDQVYAQLERLLGDHCYSLRGLCEACERFRESRDTGLDAASISKYLFRALPPVVLTRQDVRNYESEYDTLIRQAWTFLEEETVAPKT